MKPTAFLRQFLLLAGSGLLAVSSAAAQNTSATWDENNNGNWTDVTKWTGNTAYASGEDNTATLGNFINDNRTINLNADIIIGNIFAADTTHNYTISGGNTLTLDVSSGAPVIDVVTGRTLYISSAIAGADGLNKTNAGTLVLSGTVGYTGQTTITAGTLQYSGSSNLTWDAIDGAGNLTLDAASGVTLTLTGANTYSGATTVNGGTLNLGGGGATGTLSSTVLNLGGGTFSYSRTGDTTQGFTTTNLNAGLISSVSAVSGNTLNLGTIVNKVGTIDFGNTGAGTVAADTASNIGGIISGATFNGTNWAVANGAGNAITAYSGSYTTTTSAGNTAANYTGLNMSVDSSQTLGGTITTNSLRFNTAGANTLTLTGTNTVSSGGIMVNSAVGDNASLITGGTLRGSSNGSLFVVQNNTSGSSSALTIASQISNNGTSGLHKAGAGTLVFTATNNNYTGATAISGGTLEIGGSGRLGSGAYAGAIAIASGSTLHFNSSATQSLTGSISGDGGITISSGKLTLENTANTYTGPTRVYGGVFYASNSWNNAQTSLPGGTGNASTGTNLEINGGVVGMRWNFDRSLGDGPGQFKITGGRSGFGMLTDPRNTWTVNGSSAYEVVWGASGEGAATGFFNPSTLVLNDADIGGTEHIILNNKVDLNGADRTIENTNANAASYAQISGVIRNSSGTTAAGLIKTGAGELRLTGTNSYDGGTTVSGGTLQMGNASALGTTSGALTVNSGGTLDVNNNNLTVGNLTGTGGTIRNNVAGTKLLTIGDGDATGGNFQGTIVTGTGDIALTKTGIGTITLSGSNTYTGATTVGGGTLIIDGNISTSLLTTVQTGATLGGSGTVGDLTIDADGFFSPGNSPGIMTVEGDYIQNGTLIAEVTGLTPGSSGHDQVIVNGAVTLNGALSLAFNTFTPVNGDLIFILLNDGTDAISGTFTGLAQGDVAATYGGFNWQLSYTADSNITTFTGGNDVALTAVAIPEPNVAALLGGLGMLALLRRRR